MVLTRTRVSTINLGAESFMAYQSPRPAARPQGGGWVASVRISATSRPRS